jgi:hypothetical protein
MFARIVYTLLDYLATILVLAAVGVGIVAYAYLALRLIGLIVDSLGLSGGLVWLAVVLVGAPAMAVWHFLLRPVVRRLFSALGDFSVWIDGRKVTGSDDS